MKWVHQSAKADTIGELIKLARGFDGSTSLCEHVMAAEPALMSAVGREAAATPSRQNGRY
jgi:hypothetical protein